MEIKDLAGLSQPLTKLIEVVSSGMGAIYRPIGIRRDAAAQADANRVLQVTQLKLDVTRANALAQSDVSNKLVMVEANEQLQERAKVRLEHREVRRQENLEAIAAAAVAHLPEQASTASVDEDWKTRFFKTAEDVSNADMQDLWAKILAGEVASPGTYSVRTLETLKNLSQHEAEAFRKLRYLALDLGFILKVDTQGAFTDFGLTYDDILAMREAGLLADGDTLCMQITFPDTVPFFTYHFNGHWILIEKVEGGVNPIKLNSFLLTAVGKQLLSLIEPQVNIEYLKRVASANSDKASFYFGTMGCPRESFEKLTAG